MTTIDDLPDEVLEFIINLLPPYRDVEHCQLVCKRWADLVRSKFVIFYFFVENY